MNQDKNIKKLITRWDLNHIDTVVALCDCGTPTHLLAITHDLARGMKDEYFITITQTDMGSIWGRIKYALRYIWSGPFNDNVILNTEQIKELIKTLNEFLKKESESK